MFKKSKLFYIYFLTIVFVCMFSIKDASMIAQVSYTEFSTAKEVALSGVTNTVAAKPQTVILGGQVLGYTFTTNGVLVVSSNYSTRGSSLSELKEKNLISGDIILSINNKEINSSNEITEIINEIGENGEMAEITFLRKGKKLKTHIQPVYDIFADCYKIGVWIKDQMSGVGTVTFIKQDGSYGALGHPITDSATGEQLEVNKGKVYDCNIIGITKSQYGIPGELRGVISRKEQLGTVNKNTDYGIYGNMELSELNLLDSEIIEVGGKASIKPGKAEIFCALDGEKVESYDIEIIKTNYQAVSNDKSLVFKVTDKDLIDKTGGIVQGMSGSPIVQDGKLVGAVTHVFVNDSTKGFGIYIDWMLK